MLPNDEEFPVALTVFPVENPLLTLQELSCMYSCHSTWSDVPVAAEEQSEYPLCSLRFLCFLQKTRWSICGRQMQDVAPSRYGDGRVMGCSVANTYFGVNHVDVSDARLSL